MTDEERWPTSYGGYRVGDRVHWLAWRKRRPFVRYGWVTAIEDTGTCHSPRLFVDIDGGYHESFLVGLTSATVVSAVDALAGLVQ